MACPPASRQHRAVSSSSGMRRAPSVSHAPCLANCSAASRPSPADAPVRTIDLPSQLAIAEARADRLEKLLAGLLRARRTDGGLHFLLLLGRRQHGRHPERLDPELARPARRVVEML